MFQIASFKIICTDSTEILLSFSFFTDSSEILFSKLRSAGLNYHLPKLSFFTDSYCAGVSNKHCLLTFFISTAILLLLIQEGILSVTRESMCMEYWLTNLVKLSQEKSVVR